jgi:microcin C transport system substrate-binding protein
MLKERLLCAALLLYLTVPAAAGGFDPSGWQTSSDFPLIGSTEAVKGGTLHTFWSDFPATLRTQGPNSNQLATSQMQGMVYESLIGLHPETLQYIPSLADHWKVSPDKRTFYFHINPKARWADGTQVTANDVVATWEFLVRKDIKDPYSRMIWYDNYEKPQAPGPLVVSVRAKHLDWRLFYYFGTMSIYPAKEMSKLTGDEYLSGYNWKMQMGSGPYELKPQDIKNQQSITLTRRPDYWGRDERVNIGLNNFDKITWTVVRDDTLAFEKFKKGELDYYVVQKAQRWEQECGFDKVEKGWVQKRKIYNDYPQGISGFAFNMRKPPFNDRNVRKAFALLFNRAKLIDKLFFNQYSYLDSYFPGGVWADQNNPQIRYNPRMAKRLLSRAGWTTRDKDGWLTKDGKIFEVTLEYGDQGFDRIFKVVQEYMARAGIKLDLKLIDYDTLMKKVDERDFTLTYQSWSGLLFPNPESSWDSKLADQNSTTNITGFKNPEVDKLCREYNSTFDRTAQEKLVHHIDELIFRDYPYALGWSANFFRLLYYDKFGHPAPYFTRTGDDSSIFSTWWLDPKKGKALEEAEKTGASLPAGTTEQRPWEGKGKGGK